MSGPNISMTLLSENPLLNLDTESVHFIDTQDTGILHAFWSVFSKCAQTDALSNAKRLENLSWRIYSQQSLPRSQEKSTPLTISQCDFSAESIPALSTSPGSPSDDEMGTPPDSDLTTGIRHMTVIESPKTISSVKLETIVKSVAENNELEPLSPLPSSITLPDSKSVQAEQSAPVTEEALSQNKEDSNNGPTTTQSTHAAMNSSTSTMPTTAANSQLFDSNVLASTASTEPGFSASIVRGFSKDHVSRSMRSRTQLAPPQPILKQASPKSRFNPLVRTKKKTTFMVGASSEGDEETSSYESPKRSSLTQRLQEYDNSYEHNHSESAIEDDEDDDDPDDGWEDDEDMSQQDDMFQRRPSTASNPNLRSRPSLLTNMLHEKDRATALQNVASRSTPAIRRSRTSSHQGPLGTSPKADSNGRQIPQAEHAAQSMPVALSPRTSRRIMLQNELTGSLRVHLLWERQQQHPASQMLQNRGFRSEMQLSNHISNQGTQEDTTQRNDTTIYDNGLQEYFERGW